MKKKSTGEIVKIKLRTNYVGFLMPKPDEIIEQRLTITKDHMWLSKYVFGKGFGEHERVSFNHHKINEKDGLAIISKVVNHFEPADMLSLCGGIKPLFTDVGYWELELITSDGDVHSHRGSREIVTRSPLVSLSKYIRKKLNDNSLFLFDGGDERERLDGIESEHDIYNG